MSRDVVCSYGPVPNHVPYINPHIFAPDWSGMDSPFLGGPLCNPKSEPLVHSPTICADIQDTIARFLGYNHPHGSQFFPLATLTTPLFEPDCFSGGMACHCSPPTWVPSAGSICIPGIFWDRVFSLLYRTLFWTSNHYFLRCLAVICYWPKYLLKFFLQWR